MCWWRPRGPGPSSKPRQRGSRSPPPSFHAPSRRNSVNTQLPCLPRASLTPLCAFCSLPCRTLTSTAARKTTYSSRPMDESKLLRCRILFLLLLISIRVSLLLPPPLPSLPRLTLLLFLLLLPPPLQALLLPLFPLLEVPSARPSADRRFLRATFLESAAFCPVREALLCRRFLLLSHLPPLLQLRPAT